MPRISAWQATQSSEIELLARQSRLGVTRAIVAGAALREVIEHSLRLRDQSLRLLAASRAGKHAFWRSRAYAAVGAAIRDMRGKRQMSSARLAALTGVSEIDVLLTENEGCPLSPHHLFAIAATLNVSLGQLFGNYRAR